MRGGAGAAADAVRPTVIALLAVLAAAAVPLAPAPAGAATYTSPARIEAGFEAGLRALASGDAPRAIRLFRAILAEHPDLPRVRLELARAYFVARQWEDSRREFFVVLSGGVPATVKANILRFLQQIDARRGFDWTLSLGLATSPEAARQYDTDKVKVNVLGVPLPFTLKREHDGLYGVAASGSAEYRVELPSPGDGLRATAFGQGFFNLFDGNGGGADDYRLGARAGFRGAWPRTTAFLSGVVSTRYFAGAPLEDRVAAETGVEWRSASGLSLFASAAGGVVDDHVSDFRDGTFAQLRAGLAHAIGGRSLAGLAFDGEWLDARGGFESYANLGGEVFGQTDLGFGLDATARAYFLNQDYAARIPALFETRNEWEYGVDLELAKTDIFLLGQFTPYVKAGYSRRTSTISAFSYREVRFEVGIEKAF